MIKKKGTQYQVVSKTSHKNLGTYPSLKQAKKRIAQVEYFKHLKGQGQPSKKGKKK